MYSTEKCAQKAETRGPLHSEAPALRPLLRNGSYAIEEGPHLDILSRGLRVPSYATGR